LGKAEERGTWNKRQTEARKVRADGMIHGGARVIEEVLGAWAGRHDSPAGWLRMEHVAIDEAVPVDHFAGFGSDWTVLGRIPHGRCGIRPSLRRV